MIDYCLRGCVQGHVTSLVFRKCDNISGHAHVAEWSAHSAAMCSKAWCDQWPRFTPQPRHVHLPKIISSNSYAHDEQGVNPGQVRGFDGVLYKLWSLLMPWLAASRYQPRWRESQSRQLWLSPLARCWRSAGQGRHSISASLGLARQ